MGDRRMKPELMRLPDDCITHRGCPMCSGAKILGAGTHVERACQHYPMMVGQLMDIVDDVTIVQSFTPSTKNKSKKYGELAGGIRPKKRVAGGYV